MVPEHYLTSLLAGAPRCLRSTTVDIHMIRKSASAGLTGYWGFRESCQRCTMSTSKLIDLSTLILWFQQKHQKKYRGYTRANVYLQEITFQIKLGVMSNLCTDLILGHECLKMQQEVIFMVGEIQDWLTVLNYTGLVCCVAAAEFDPPHLFQFLDSRFLYSFLDERQLY